MCDPVVAGGFVVPTAVLGVGFQGLDVGELVAKGIPEFGCGDVVVAGFADVGIRAGASGRMASAVAVRNAGFEHLAVEPTICTASRPEEQAVSTVTAGPWTPRA
jgi:hypothetical protein